MLACIRVMDSRGPRNNTWHGQGWAILRAVGLLGAFFAAPSVFAQQLTTGKLNAQDGTALTEDAIKCGSAAQGGCGPSASGGATSPSSGTSPQNSNEVAPAAFQKDTYVRADENLTTQTVYLERRVETLRGLEDDITTKAESDDDIGQSLRDRLANETEGMCQNQGANDTQNFKSKSDANQCLNDYLETKRAELERMKPLLIGNENSVTRLQSRPVDADNKPLGGATTAFVVSENVPRGSTVRNVSPPFVPKFVDLTPAYDKSAPVDAKVWAQEVARAPTGSDFYKTTDVLIDPAHPESGTTKVLQLDAKGQPVVDQAALNQAMEQYKSNATDPKSIYKERAGSGADFEKRLEARAIAAQKSQNNQSVVKIPRKGQFALADTVRASHLAEDPEGKLDKDNIRHDYVGARNLIVKNFKGEVPPPQPKPGAPKSGDHNVDVEGRRGLAGQQAQQQQGKQLDFTSPELMGYKEEAFDPAKQAAVAGKKPIDSLYLDPADIDSFVQDDLGLTQPAAVANAANAGGGSGGARPAVTPPATPPAVPAPATPPAAPGPAPASAKLP